MPLTYEISLIADNDVIEAGILPRLEENEEISPYKITVIDNGQRSSFQLINITLNDNGFPWLAFYDLVGERCFVKVSHELYEKGIRKIEESFLAYINKANQESPFVYELDFSSDTKKGWGWVSAFEKNSNILKPNHSIICINRVFERYEPFCFILPGLARLHQSTFGGHLYRTIAGMVLLASLLCLLFLSPAWLSLLPLLGKTLGSMAFGLQSIFPTALAKTLLATLGGFLAFTAPKWFGNLLQLVGIRLLGGVVGRIISASMLLARVGIFIVGFIVGIIPALLLKQCSKKAWNHCLPLLQYCGFFLASLPGLPLLIVCSLGAIIMDTIGRVISGEYQHIPKVENKSNSSVWNKISLALGNPIPAAETLKRDPAIIDPINRFSWAKKYDRFCHFFRSDNEFLGNLCYAKERGNFKKSWKPN